MKKKILKITGAILSATLMLVGISISSENTTSENLFIKSAKASGTCCEQRIAICLVDGLRLDGYYYQSSGPCSSC